jgi:hypothetical protein
MHGIGVRGEISRDAQGCRRMIPDQFYRPWLAREWF